MPDAKLLQEISEKESDKAAIAARVIENPELLATIFEGLNAQKARVKYGCDKVLRIISGKAPEILYPKIDFFIESLDSENNILKWSAIHVIANLASIDAENKVEKIFEKYFAPIPGPVLIAAANVIKGAARIAFAKPALTGRVVEKLLKVEKAEYQTDECRDIALGHAVQAFDAFFDIIQDKEPVIELVKRQVENSRPATSKKAVKFLKEHQG